MSTLAPVGFVGLGTMGGGMCRRLAETGFPLLAYDIRPEALEAPPHGVRAAASLQMLGAAADIVVVMLPDGVAVRDVVTTGLAPAMAAGSVVVDMSSSAALGTLELASELHTRGIALVDAPVSGSPAAAATGELTIMVGGDDAAVERCRPVLNALGSVMRTGSLASGHAVKALNNTLAAVALAASAEALLVARRFGLDPAVVLDVLNRSTGRNDATENKLRQFVLSRAFASGFKLELMAKDLRTAAELAEATDSPFALGGACLELWRAALDDLGPGADNTAVVLAMEEAAGATLVSDDRAAAS